MSTTQEQEDALTDIYVTLVGPHDDDGDANAKIQAMRDIITGEPHTIQITIKGGCLQEVAGLPDNWDYELIDNDLTPEPPRVEQRENDEIDALLVKLRDLDANGWATATDGSLDELSDGEVTQTLKRAIDTIENNP